MSEEFVSFLPRRHEKLSGFLWVNVGEVGNVGNVRDVGVDEARGQNG